MPSTRRVAAMLKAASITDDIFRCFTLQRLTSTPTIHLLVLLGYFDFLRHTPLDSTLAFMLVTLELIINERQLKLPAITTLSSR
jgi:hypothetical protein